MERHNPEEDHIRRYLLKQLSESDTQELELRLLKDEDLDAELEIAEDELIDAYLAKELSATDRASFERDFLTNPARSDKLKSAQALRRYLKQTLPTTTEKSGEESFWTRIFQPFKLGSGVTVPAPALVAVAVLFVATIGLIVWRTSSGQSDIEKGLVALNEAYRRERPIEARVSSLNYAPFVRTRGAADGAVDNLEFSRAERLLLDAEKSRGDAASAHALGKLYLLRRDYVKAIEYLERAAKSDTRNARLLADLGAAYFEKGRVESGTDGGKRLADLGRSLEYLKRALEIDPNLLEALFNRGLVHQEQGLYNEAEADWRTYLEKDQNSQWSVDAREYLDSLDARKNQKPQATASPHDDFMRAYEARDGTRAWEIYRNAHTGRDNKITASLVDQLLASPTPHDELQALIYLGKLAIDNTADTFNSDLAKVYSSATSGDLVVLRKARAQVTEGQKLTGRSQFSEAAKLFAEAKNSFDSVGDKPESMSTAAAIAHAALFQPNPEKAKEILTWLVPACEENNYRWLLGRALRHRAHFQSNLNNYSAAISDGSRALQIFQEFGDVNSVTASHIQLATIYSLLNDSESSLSFLEQAQATAQGEALPADIAWGIFISTSLNLKALKLGRAALDYQTEALALALQKDTPLLISRSYQYLGLTHGTLRQFDLAFDNLHKAYELGRTTKDGPKIMAYAALGLGDLYRNTGDYTSALTSYDESSRIDQSLHFAHYDYAAHKGKFLTYLNQKNDALAAQELEVVLKLFEEAREQILEERQKNSFFDSEQDTYDLAIDFTYSRLGDQRRAFDYSEVCRGRNLRDLTIRGTKIISGVRGLDLTAARENAIPPPMTLEQIKANLPEQIQLIQYVVLEKKVLVWSITRSDVSSAAIDIESSQLDGIISRTLNQIRLRDTGVADSLKQLFALLVEPVGKQLKPNTVLCFIPDKSLHYLPFGALISTATGRYLTQDHAVMTSPSATVFIESTNRASTLAANTRETLLAVGNPTLDRSANPALDNLENAELEVEDIARSYSPHRILIGANATPTAVKEALVRADVTHFAAHYQIDSRSQLGSRVLLAPERGERAHAEVAGLTSSDIYQLRLPRSRLVVLAACQTGIEQQVRGEGPIGFARSFLVSGTPVVVASLWPVDTEATAALMVQFHRFRKLDHLSTTAALARAQQKLITHDKYSHPYYWAGFTVTGGYSSF